MSNDCETMQNKVSRIVLCAKRKHYIMRILNFCLDFKLRISDRREKFKLGNVTGLLNRTNALSL